MSRRFNRPTRGCSVNVMKSDIIRVAIAPAKGKVADEALWVTENNAFVFGGDAVSGNRVNNVTLVNPLISHSVGDTGWLLVHRPILPVWSSLPIPDPPDGFASNKGIGDFTYFKEQLHVFKPLWYSRNSKGFPVSI